MANVPESIASPCIRQCCLDAQNVCLGCKRTLSEICRWSEASQEEKLAILKLCQLRKCNAPQP